MKEGGLSRSILGDKLRIVEFPEMTHGWTVRGDLSDPKVAKDTKAAIEEAFKFVEQHMRE